MVLGFWRLVRIVPVISWSLSAIAIGASLAWAQTGRLHWGHLSLIVLAALLVQGLLAHAINEREDWRSGTDRRSTGILSGGTRLMRDGVFTERDMVWIAALSAAVFVALGAYFHQAVGPAIWWAVAAGLWAGIAYTQPPLRLAYRPLLGEWLAGWPAMLAITVATYFILTGGAAPTPAVLWGGALHGLFCIAWLMQHHRTDIPADLTSSPPKLTTPAWLHVRRGAGADRWAPAAYFALAAVLGGTAAWVSDARFAVTPLLALPGMALALAPGAGDVPSLTRRQLGMMGLTGAHALALALLF